MDQENFFCFCIGNNGNYTSVKVFGSYAFRAKNEQNEINAVFYDSVLRTFKSNYPEVFLRKAVLRKCSKFTGERPCQSDISIELLCNFIEIAFQHGCFPVNLLHFFRTSFLKNTSGRLLLKIISDESTATVNQYYTSKTFKKLILDLKETVKKYFSSKNINRLIFVQPYIS